MIERLALSTGMSVLCGLDRTALLQVMVSRPIAAAPLTGLLLGDAATGLLVGALLELLWLGRLPMGAAIPPDDTQIAVASTLLAVEFGTGSGQSDPALVLLTLLVALPLGKVGAPLDQWARRRNGRLNHQVLDQGPDLDVRRAEFAHLIGILHFVAASLATFFVIVGGGWLVLTLVREPLLGPLRDVEALIFMVFPLVGMAHLLANLNVKRAISLFSSSFLMSFLLLWLI